MQIISFIYPCLLIKTYYTYYRKIAEKIRGYPYKITHITADPCSELPNLVLN